MEGPRASERYSITAVADTRDAGQLAAGDWWATMNGEDVYDMAADSYCRICDEYHGPCELPDLRYDCLKCLKPIMEGDEVMVDGEPFHDECAKERGR
jgi:hypothetical protein